MECVGGRRAPKNLRGSSHHFAQDLARYGRCKYVAAGTRGWKSRAVPRLPKTRPIVDTIAARHPGKLGRAICQRWCSAKFTLTTFLWKLRFRNVEFRNAAFQNVGFWKHKSRKVGFRKVQGPKHRLWKARHRRDRLRRGRFWRVVSVPPFPKVQVGKGRPRKTLLHKVLLWLSYRRVATITCRHTQTEGYEVQHDLGLPIANP